MSQGRTDDMIDVRVLPDGQALAEAAADLACTVIVDAIAADGVANVVFATGNSQRAFLGALVGRAGVDWTKVVGFHMDEYIGMGADHPASFRRYLRERLVALVPLRAFHEIIGDAADPGLECERYAALLRAHPLHLCCLGIGENGHLAFNDPPVADFDDPCDVKVVTLDDACRRQQVGEGHFPTIGDVPTRAITVTIPALLRAQTVIAVVPDARKRAPVAQALTGPIEATCPASALRTHPRATLFLDRDSAGAVAS